ncbi:hypothetical protein M5K25_015041 [Dendrobium thyrsiflorum]|uniref:C2H2-type domain-containing protein n=1 Tax=Dendrobium thyrsiflorum TaxID=117978 RepID=A0ABD0UPB8_DENTH
MRRVLQLLLCEFEYQVAVVLHYHEDYECPAIKSFAFVLRNKRYLSTFGSRHFKPSLYDITFNPARQPTHKIKDIIRSKYDAPYLSWKKIPQEVRDIKTLGGCLSIMQKKNITLKRNVQITCEICLLKLQKMHGREPNVLELHTRTHQCQVDHQWVDQISKKAYRVNLPLVRDHHRDPHSSPITAHEHKWWG